jgi:hypothetical protein
MPCAPGMSLCAATCAHRRFVHDYRTERRRQAGAREDVTKGYAAELADHPPIVDFKTWLLSHSSDLSLSDAMVDPTPDDWEPPPGF